MKILTEDLDILDQILVDVLVQRSCEDPSEILDRSSYDLVDVLVRRSCEDPGDILSQVPAKK